MKILGSKLKPPLKREATTLTKENLPNLKEPAVKFSPQVVKKQTKVSLLGVRVFEIRVPREAGSSNLLKFCVGNSFGLDWPNLLSKKFLPSERGWKSVPKLFMSSSNESWESPLKGPTSLMESFLIKIFQNSDMFCHPKMYDSDTLLGVLFWCMLNNHSPQFIFLDRFCVLFL